MWNIFPDQQFQPGDAEQNVRDIPPIIVDIINFVNLHSEKITVIDEDFQGGWKGWLQVELALLLHNKYPQPLALSREYSVEREAYAYIASKQRIDLWCRSNKEFFGDGGDKYICVRCRDSGADHPRIGIELKCFTFYKDHLERDNKAHPRGGNGRYSEDSSNELSVHEAVWCASICSSDYP